MGASRVSKRAVPVVAAVLAAVLAALIAASCSSGSSSSKTKGSTKRGTTTTEKPATTTAPAKPVDQTPPKGTNGLAADGKSLWVADFTGSQVLKIDPATGRILARYGQAEGVTTSDDVVVGPDHDVYWTGLVSGNVGRIAPDGTVTKIAHVENASVNPITFAKDGKLFAGATEAGTGLYEIDPTGKKPPRIVAPAWDTNAFAFGPDGMLYGPKRGLNGEGAVMKVDLNTGVITEVKKGFSFPAAVKFDKSGKCFVLSVQGTVLQRLDLATGQVTDVAKAATPIVDNFAFGNDGRIYISSYNQNVLTVVAPDGTTSTVNIGG